MDPAEAHERLVAGFRAHGRTIVAFSGGVDSAVLAKVAHDALGSANALAIIVVSESYAREEREAAEAFARAMEIPHEVVWHSELADSRYTANPVNRCYFCREGLADVLHTLAQERGYQTIAAGTNADDLQTYRPGDQALHEAGIWQPFVELGLSKENVRALAKHLALPVWDKPSMACLSSRIPHGEPVTLGKLTRIGRAEGILRARGFRQVRVRTLEDGALARIEVMPNEQHALEQAMPQVEPALRLLGYERIEIDPRGYRMGSLSQDSPIA